MYKNPMTNKKRTVVTQPLCHCEFSRGAERKKKKYHCPDPGEADMLSECIRTKKIR